MATFPARKIGGRGRDRRAGIPAMVVAAVLVTGCASATSDPPAGPPAGGSEAELQAATALQASPAHADADVRFMQHMIVHHAQALEMTGLVSTRTQNPVIQRLAERIELSQRDEIALMQRWLEQRGEPSAMREDDHAHHRGHHHGQAGGHHDDSAPAMPGMLSGAEMARLAAARGDEFDRLFLELMIRHHEGALVMVEELFSSVGAGQEPEIFRVASEVDSDQRAEIERMQRMIEAM